MAALKSCRMGRYARHGAPSQLLAQLSVSGSAPILLSGGGRRNRHLADGSGAKQEAICPYLGTRLGGQRTSQPRIAPPCHEDGDRRGQDHRDGDADRVANGECRALIQPAPTSRAAFWSSRQASRSKIACASCCPATSKAITAPANLFPATCWTTSTRPRSSSPITTRLQLREMLEVNKVGRSLLQGRHAPIATKETEGQMVRRVAEELMGLKNIVVINDEAHHCYREKPDNEDIDDLKGDDKKEAVSGRNEAARLWISGIECFKRKLGRARRLRPLRHAVLPARFGLCRRHALPVDDQRLFADGRHRMRHRETAARSYRRQYPRGRRSGVPRSVGTYPRRHAQEGTR